MKTRRIVGRHKGREDSTMSKPGRQERNPARPERNPPRPERTDSRSDADGQMTSHLPEKRKRKPSAKAKVTATTATTNPTHAAAGTLLKQKKATPLFS